MTHTTSAARLLAAALFLAGGATVRAETGRVTRVACIGDSITFGLGLADREAESYPALLGRLLGDSFEVRNFGVSGATLLRRGNFPYRNTPQFREAAAYAPDIVIILLGTNDSKPLNWRRHKDAFAPDLRGLAQHFLGLPTTPRVWLCLPTPVYRVLPTPSDNTIRSEIIPRIRQVAHELGLPVIDLHTPMENRPDVFPDRVHPNAEGAEIIAKIVYQELVR
ncbi:MAG: hypothetical protein JXB04_07555 [Kiritimatiellae bacterium]|nr:hypothetical protein [Kiritimatiellia bacterium]